MASPSKKPEADKATQATPEAAEATTKLAGEFDSPEALAAAYVDLKAQIASLQEQVANPQDVRDPSLAAAIANVIKGVRAKESANLGEVNIHPGVQREPQVSKLHNGTVREDY